MFVQGFTSDLTAENIGKNTVYANSFYAESLSRRINCIAPVS